MAAVLAIVVAPAGALSVTALAVPGNPPRWLTTLPLAWWGSGRTTFASRYVRLWRPARWCAMAWTARATGRGVTLAVVGSLLSPRGRLGAREGPAR